VNAAQILNALERERQLLQEFRSISQQQLVLVDAEDIEGVNQLLDHRSDLMLELTAIESTLGTWIEQIRQDASVTQEMMKEFRSVNEEIIELANHVVEIDEQTHWRLDLIKTRCGDELRSLNRGAKALRGYDRSFGVIPDLEGLI